MDTTKPDLLELSEASKQAVRQFTADIVTLLQDQPRRLTEQMKDFDENFKQVQEEMKRGLRRTSGRII
jgi:hypothetical protein